MIVDIDTTAIPGFHLPGDPTTILLRVFALQTFTSDDGLRIIQAGPPNDGPWYKETICNVSGTTVSIPALQLESQTDAFNPGEHGARYYAAFYRTDGGFIAPFDPLANFQVRHDYNPTTWQKIIAYNTAPYVPAGAWQTYTRGQIDGLFKLLPSTSTGAGAVVSVFGRTGAVVAANGDYDIPKITGLQAALDAKAPSFHSHDASVITSGVVAPAHLGTGLTTPTTQFLRGDGTWAVPPTGSGPGGGVNTVFGRLGPDIFALSGDYDIPKISGLQSALDSKAGLPHFHDGSAITAGFINPARLGSLPDSTKFLRGDGVWATVTGTTGTLDLAANYTWTGAHVFKATSGTFTVLGAAGVKEIIGVQGDSGVSSVNWPSLLLDQGTGTVLAYDIDGTTNNRQELRLDAAGFHLRGGIRLERSSDGVSFIQYAGTSFTGGNTAFNIVATAAGSQSAGYTIGGLPGMVQVYASALFNSQSLTGDVVTQFPGKRHGFAFNAADRYSVMIDSDPADGAINTPLFIRYNGQLRRIVSDSSKVLSWAVLGGTPDATVFLRGDGVWATPAGTGPGGAVSSVGLTVDLTMFASPGPAVTSSGTLNVAFAAQAASGSAGKFLAGPVSGSAVPTFRTIGASDIPALDAGSITTGLIAPARLAPTPDPAKFLRGDSTWQTPPGGTGTGTVTSVTVSPPSSIMLATGNPITGPAAGIITLVLQAQADKYVFCSPVGGGTPLFRLLATTDIPPLATTQITSGIFPAGRLGAGSSDYQYFLRGDSTWQLISSIGSSSAPVGPALTIAAFDSGGAMVTTLAASPITYSSTDINFIGRGLMLQNGYACNERYSNGNVCNVFFVDDNGTNGRMLIGPFNSADGTQTSGITAIFRTGHGLSADGSKAGELILDSRSSGGLGAGVGNSLLAGAHWKGWFAISNYSTTTGVPLAPTAPLTVGRNDGNSNLVDLYVRGVVGAPLKINANAWTSPSNTMRTLGAVTWMFSNSADSARTSRLDFYIVQNQGDLLKMRLEPASGPNNTGLFLSRSSDPPGSGPTEVVLLDSTTFPGFRYLALPM